MFDLDEIARRIGALSPAQLEALDRKILGHRAAAPRSPSSDPPPPFAQEPPDVAAAPTHLELLDPAALLARMDELSATEVDALLETLLAPAAAEPTAAAAPRAPAPGQAQELLAQLGELSDDRVDALLSELLEAETTT
jgi:hypothetical protein